MGRDDTDPVRGHEPEYPDEVIRYVAEKYGHDHVAQAVLSTSVSDVEDTAAPHSLTTMVLGATESAISGETWTIKKTDGSTTFATKTVTSDTDANPITGVT